MIYEVEVKAQITYKTTIYGADFKDEAIESAINELNDLIGFEDHITDIFINSSKIIHTEVEEEDL